MQNYLQIFYEVATQLTVHSVNLIIAVMYFIYLTALHNPADTLSVLPCYVLIFQYKLIVQVGYKLERNFGKLAIVVTNFFCIMK